MGSGHYPFITHHRSSAKLSIIVFVEQHRLPRPAILSSVFTADYANLFPLATWGQGCKKAFTITMGNFPSARQHKRDKEFSTELSVYSLDLWFSLLLLLLSLLIIILLLFYFLRVKSFKILPLLDERGKHNGRCFTQNTKEQGTRMASILICVTWLVTWSSSRGEKCPVATKNLFWKAKRYFKTERITKCGSSVYYTMRRGCVYYKV